MTDKEKEKMNEPYMGEERRHGPERRVASDRRDMIRFEPDKTDRRSGKDRRGDKNSGWDSGTTI
jgi:hypothetical protein